MNTTTQKFPIEVGREYITKYRWSGKLVAKDLGYKKDMVRLIRYKDRAPILVHINELTHIIE
ncbi:hypothetical protein [Belliella pelovolcani]|uniref:hypothetical protein n=1 Tax=Belliella pelovolcani TaxID=529505 RepID=UPI00391A2BFD